MNQNNHQTTDKKVATLQQAEGETFPLIRVSGTVSESITDGPGMRFALFTQGCPHACAGCHNPATHPFVGGTMCSATELFDKVHSNPLLSGVTLSGGEPFAQAEALLPFAKLVKDAGLELAAYSGYLFEDLCLMPAARALLGFVDVLIDGPFLEAERSLELNFKGSKNQRTLDVKKSLQAGVAVLTEDPRWIKKGGDFYMDIPL